MSVLANIFSFEVTAARLRNFAGMVRWRNFRIRHSSKRRYAPGIWQALVLGAPKDEWGHIDIAFPEFGKTFVRPGTNRKQVLDHFKRGKFDAILVWGARESGLAGFLKSRAAFPVQVLGIYHGAVPVLAGHGALRSYALSIDEPYINTRRPNDLERLIAYPPLLDDSLQAQALDLPGLFKMPRPERKTGKPHILVITQHLRDPALRLATVVQYSPDEFVEHVRKENPDSKITVLPTSPFVNFQPQEVLPQNIDDSVTVLPVNHPIGDALKGVDGVHVISSELGFEALLAGYPVDVYGVPVYAGWGLTRDHATVLRRDENRSLAELAAAAILQHPRWIDAGRNRIIAPLQLADMLAGRAGDIGDLKAAGKIRKILQGQASGRDPEGRKDRLAAFHRDFSRLQVRRDTAGAWRMAQQLLCEALLKAARNDEFAALAGSLAGALDEGPDSVMDDVVLKEAMAGASENESRIEKWLREGKEDERLFHEIEKEEARQLLRAKKEKKRKDTDDDLVSLTLAEIEQDKQDIQAADRKKRRVSFLDQFMAQVYDVADEPAVKESVSLRKRPRRRPIPMPATAQEIVSVTSLQLHGNQVDRAAAILDWSFDAMVERPDLAFRIATNCLNAGLPDVALAGALKALEHYWGAPGANAAAGRLVRLAAPLLDDETNIANARVVAGANVWHERSENLVRAANGSKAAMEKILNLARRAGIENALVGGRARLKGRLAVVRDDGADERIARHKSADAREMVEFKPLRGRVTKAVSRLGALAGEEFARAGAEMMFLPDGQIVKQVALHMSQRLEEEVIKALRHEHGMAAGIIKSGADRTLVLLSRERQNLGLAQTLLVRRHKVMIAGAGAPGARLTPALPGPAYFSPSQRRRAAISLEWFMRGVAGAGSAFAGVRQLDIEKDDRNGIGVTFKKAGKTASVKIASGGFATSAMALAWCDLLTRVVVRRVMARARAENITGFGEFTLARTLEQFAKGIFADTVYGAIALSVATKNGAKLRIPADAGIMAASAGKAARLAGSAIAGSRKTARTLSRPQTWRYGRAQSRAMLEVGESEKLAVFVPAGDDADMQVLQAKSKARKKYGRFRVML
ncbi:MAG TPA: hypothetical protein ENJ99_01780, partial [Rhizobiales bacterium]|nr:hypothetical protein [Hyphomicrobiales bacterium]